MTGRPINMHATNVRALIAGQKTQTRRVIKPHKQTARRGPSIFAPGQWADSYVLDPGNAGWLALDVPYAIGDRLWVREGFAGERAAFFDRKVLIYRAGHEEESGPGPRVDMKWRSPATMPRWASRLTLTATEVRVQRLQDISEEDARAEGVYFVAPTDEDRAWRRARCEESGVPDDSASMQGVWMAPGTRQGWGMTKEDRAREQWGPTAAFAYRCVWESLHGAGAWALNPWVCAIGVTVEQRNIDEGRS